MRRHTVRPFGQAIPATRLFSLLLALGLIWMLIDRLGDPATWKFVGFRDDGEPRTVTTAKVPTEPATVEELVIPGPNDLDEDELADFNRKLELVTNKAKLRPREMLLYWQLMEWACTQKMRDLEKRALKDVIFRQIWEEPKKYQGKLLRLRIRAQQTVRYDTPTNKEGQLENTLGLKEVFEVVGPTEDSIPFHYFLVCPEKPAALTLGNNDDQEIVFVGYFLKIMEYGAKDGNTRGAPLLIGRMRMVGGNRVGTKSTPSNTGLYITIAILVGFLAAGFYAYTSFQARQKAERKPLPAELPNLILGPESESGGDFPGSFDEPKPPDSPPSEGPPS